MAELGFRYPPVFRQKGIIMKIRSFSLLVLLIALLCLAAPAFAQGDRGSITGQITDTSGAVIPNVEVTATQLATNTTFKAVSTSTGVYHIEYLQAGNYRVSASFQGFKTAVVEPVVVSVASVVTANLTLELGATNESVTVSAEATRLESSSSELGYNVSAEDYHDWVVASNDDGQRQIQSFIFASLPGTAGDSGTGSINGAPTASHEVYIEGISIGRADVAGDTAEFEPSVDAISEFRLQTGSLNAAYGGGLTAVANFNVKSGTNQLHGTGYEYFMNNDLNANQFENNADGLGQAPFKQNSFGTAVGGPLVIPKIYNGKNRSFWFFSYEGTRRRQGLISGFRTMPTTAFKQGDFSALPQAIYDPYSTVQLKDGSYSRTPFPGNIIPASDISTVSANILKLAPTPDPTLPGDFNNLLGINGAPIFNLNTYTGKFDQTITDKHKLSFYWSDSNRDRYNGSHAYLPFPGTASSPWNNQGVYGTMVRVGYDWTITTNLLNHFAFGYNNFDNDHYSLSTGQNWPSKIGLTGVDPQTFPGINFIGSVAQGGKITPMGNNSTGDSPNGSYIVANDTTWIHGAHQTKWGVEVRKYFYIEPQNWGASGSFTFGPNTTADPNNLGTTGYAYASFLLGMVNSASMPVAYVSTTKTIAWNPSFYVTDDWKVTRRLTLNFGLRWDIAGAESEIHGVSSTLGPTTANPGAGGYPGALVFLNGRGSFQNTYYGEVGPRAGFAYQLSKRLVLRGGYGLMYTPPLANAFGMATVDGYVGNNYYAPTVMNAVFNWDKGFPAYPFALPDKAPALDNGGTISYTAANSARQPYAQNYTFGVQYLLGEKTVIQASYVGNIGSRLSAGSFANMNQLNPKYLSLGDELLQNCSTTGSMCAPGIPLPYAGFTGTVAQALLPFPQYSGGGTAGVPTGTGVFYHFPYFGHSSYNALQVVATRRLSKGLGFLVSYAFQKTLTNTDGASIYYASSQDVYNRKLEKSVAFFDHTQQLRLTWIYELPFGKGRPYLNKGGIVNQVLGGWTITANQQYQSGDPLSIGTSIYTGDYLYNDAVRADLVPGQPLMSTQSGSLNFAAGIGKPYLNPNAFVNPPMTPNGVILSLGNTPRYFGNLRGPWLPSENAGIFKRFPFGESRFFEVRCDMLNVFNRVQLSDPDTTVGDPQFGQILGVSNVARQIQLAMRLTF